MAQRLEALIARTDVLRRFAQHIAGFRMLGLPQGLSLGPVPEALRPSNDDNEGTPGAWSLPDAIAAAAAEVSRSGIVGWIETTPGWEGAVIWRNGVHSAPDDRNMLLRNLGVVPTVPRVEHGWLTRRILRPTPPRPLSEWQTLGLDNWLTSQGAYDVAEPVETVP